VGAPVVQHRLQPAIVQHRLHLVFRQPGQSTAGQRSGAGHAHGVEGPLAGDAHAQFVAILAEIPRHQPTMRGQAQGDAVVVCQLVRMPWHHMLAEVAGRADHAHAQRRADRHGDHVARQPFAEADADVVALGHDVGQPVVGGQFHLQIRILLQQRRQPWPCDVLGGVAGGIDADGAGRAFAVLGQRGQPILDLGQAWAQGIEQAGAGFGGGDAAGGAGQQAHAETFFQAAHGMTERGLGYAQLGGGLGEAALAGNVDEGLQVVEVFAGHDGMIRLPD
jgi:hypothetical protein